MHNDLSTTPLMAWNQLLSTHNELADRIHTIAGTIHSEPIQIWRWITSQEGLPVDWALDIFEVDTLLTGLSQAGSLNPPDPLRLQQLLQSLKQNIKLKFDELCNDVFVLLPNALRSQMTFDPLMKRIKTNAEQLSWVQWPEGSDAKSWGGSMGLYSYAKTAYDSKLTLEFQSLVWRTHTQLPQLLAAGELAQAQEVLSSILQNARLLQAVEWPVGSEARLRGGSMPLGRLAKETYDIATQTRPLQSIQQTRSVHADSNRAEQTTSNNKAVEYIAGSEDLQGILSLNAQQRQIQGGNAYRSILRQSRLLWHEGFQGFSADEPPPSFQKLLEFLEAAEARAFFENFSGTPKDLHDLQILWGMLDWIHGVFLDLKHLHTLTGDVRQAAQWQLRKKIAKVKLDCEQNMSNTWLKEPLLRHLEVLRGKVPAQ